MEKVLKRRRRRRYKHSFIKGRFMHIKRLRVIRKISLKGKRKAVPRAKATNCSLPQFYKFAKLHLKRKGSKKRRFRRNYDSRGNLKKWMRRSVTLSYNPPKRKRRSGLISKNKQSRYNSCLKQCFFGYERYFYKIIKRLRYKCKLNFEVESKMLVKLRKDLQKQERYKRLKTPAIFRDTFQPLSERVFSFGRVHITQLYRNTFITITTKSEDKAYPNELVIYKSSCGTAGFPGPKRKTNYARLQVAKDANIFMADQQLTTIDIVFHPSFNRKSLPFIRSLCKNMIYIRYVFIPKRKPHGTVRKKKAKRL